MLWRTLRPLHRPGRARTVVKGLARPRVLLEGGEARVNAVGGQHLGQPRAVEPFRRRLVRILHERKVIFLQVALFHL
jgi:hypothetical protein